MRAGGHRAVAWPDARARAYDNAAPLCPRRLPLRDAAGCVLAEPLRALVALPPFDTAAMDGWAVRGDGPWAPVGQVLAGHAGGRELRSGEAVEVATGAVVPAGVEAVVPYEHAVRAAGQVRGRVERGRHIRWAGEECQEGTVLLPAGRPLSAAALGLAAAVGHDGLLVHPAPTLIALATGDELLQRGRPSGARIRDAIGPMLQTAVRDWGGTLLAIEHLPDDEQQLRKAIDAADADVILTTGASSLGPADFLTSALTGLRAELLVDGVRVRPGHPQLLARLPGGRLVVGVPGNPLAALASLVTLLVPVLAGLAAKPRPDSGQARLAQAVQNRTEDHRLVPVRQRAGAVEVCDYAGSAMLRGAAAADGFAVVPPGLSLVRGSRVEIVPLP